jgi:hypothetical protein
MSSPARKKARSDGSYAKEEDYEDDEDDEDDEQQAVTPKQDKAVIPVPRWKQMAAALSPIAFFDVLPSPLKNQIAKVKPQVADPNFFKREIDAVTGTEYCLYNPVVAKCVTVDTLVVFADHSGGRECRVLDGREKGVRS